MSSRYFENVAILKELGCKGVEVLTENEAILCAQISNQRAGRRMVAQSHEYAIVAIQSALIAGLTEGPEQAMVWLHNFLDGPGLLPTDEDVAMGAQAYCDKNQRLPGV